MYSNMDGPRGCHTAWSKSGRGELLHDILSVGDLKRNDTNELTKQKQTHRLRKGAYGRWGRMGEGYLGVWDGHVQTATFRMDNQQGPAVQSMELCSAHMAAWMGWGVGRMETCVRTAGAPCCSLEPSWQAVPQYKTMEVYRRFSSSLQGYWNYDLRHFLVKSFHSFICKGFPDGSVVKNPPANAEDAGNTGSIFLGREDPLE